MRIGDHDHLIIADEVDDAVEERLDTFVSDHWDSLATSVERCWFRPLTNEIYCFVEVICRPVARADLLLVTLLESIKVLGTCDRMRAPG